MKRFLDELEFTKEEFAGYTGIPLDGVERHIALGNESLPRVEQVMYVTMIQDREKARLDMLRLRKSFVGMVNPYRQREP